MKIKEIQRKGENLYTVTFEKRTLWGRKEVVRDVYDAGMFIKYASEDEICHGYYQAIKNLITHLNGYEPLKVNYQ